MTRPAEPERHDPRMGASNPHRSTWDCDDPYYGPPEEGQPRMGNRRSGSDAELARRASAKQSPGEDLRSARSFVDLARLEA